MSLKIKYYPVLDLPKLAWLTSLDLKSFTELLVLHGSSVECRDTWMVEGVWDGDFSSGDFHKAENFFGSGIRVEGERVYVVPSSALVDHLFYCIDHETLLVSNSLVVLLGFTGAILDDTHDYHNESVSIAKGIKAYTKEFTIIHPEIECFYQVFYENVVVTKEGISFELKDGLQEITSYEQYYELLWDILCRIKNNYQDPNRTIPLAAFTTLSSGYDSTAVSCLARRLGVDTCFTLKKSASWIRWSPKHATDDGTLAAQALNLNIIYADTSPTTITEDELYFLSTNYGKSKISAVYNEIAHASMAAHIEQHCSAAVLFTGYHGDKVWDIDTPEEFLGEELAQSTGANFGFSEIRLKSGFINVALPFILARNIRSIVAISCSDGMKLWSLNNGYDRPIARRIAETSGVPREAFGMRKKGVAQHYYRLPKSLTFRRLFLQYLKKRYDLSPWFVYTNHTLNQTALIFQKAILRTFRPKQKHRCSTLFWPNLDIGFIVWIWASNLLSKRMGQVFHGHVKVLPDARKKQLRSQAREDQHTLLESQLNSNGHESRAVV
jgi:hypothetical protein